MSSVSLPFTLLTVSVCDNVSMITPISKKSFFFTAQYLKRVLYKLSTAGQQDLVMLELSLTLYPRKFH